MGGVGDSAARSKYAVYKTRGGLTPNPDDLPEDQQLPRDRPTTPQNPGTFGNYIPGQIKTSNAGPPDVTPPPAVPDTTKDIGEIPQIPDLSDEALRLKARLARQRLLLGSGLIGPIGSPSATFTPSLGGM